MKLFWNRKDRTHWIAFTKTTGLVAFPAETDGWRKRKPATHVELEQLREIPIRLAVNAGIPDGSAKRSGE